MKNLLIGIDIGTSACKLSVFDRSGQVLFFGAEKYSVYHRQPGFAEQNPMDWWQAVCILSKRCAASDVPMDDIAGIGIDGQGWAAVLMSKNGDALCNTPIWYDTRAQGICDRILKIIPEDEIFALSGNSLRPGYTLPKVLWYKENSPDLYGRTTKILQSNGYIAYKLTGNFSMDQSQGYAFACFDVRFGQWDYKMCGRMGIDDRLLPDICGCHDIIGEVTKEAARQTGLPAGIPVVAGGLDAACGTLGAGVICSGQTQEQGGQAGGMSICLDQYAADPKLILGRHVIPGKWLLQGGTVGGGGVANWMARELSVSSFAELDNLAGTVSPGSDGVVFLPYMAGERSPVWDPYAKGVYYGLDFSKTKAHLLRAGLEGVAFALRHNLETAEACGVSVGSLISAGGAANSELWMQIKADITGKPIVAARSDHAAALGAAILAGVGTGVYAGFDEAVSLVAKTGQPKMPNLSNFELYKKLYEKYINIYSQLKEVMNDR